MTPDIAELKRLAEAALIAIQPRPIEEALTDGTLYYVYAAPAHGLPGLWTVCGYHQEAGWCVDELREVTHFIPRPTVPPWTGFDYILAELKVLRERNARLRTIEKHIELARKLYAPKSKSLPKS